MSSRLSLDAALAGLGMPVPESSAAKKARHMLQAAAPAFLVNHSVRSYAWAVALADHDSVAFDPEILYVAALLHDLGLVSRFDTGGCFEEDGALASERLVLDAGWPVSRGRAVRDAIRLHMAGDLSADAAPESQLLWDSTGVDVTGYRFADVPEDIVRRVVDVYPRLDFKRLFAALFADQATRKPACRAAEMVRGDMLARIQAAPFDS
jgi:hypothetical protein